jgi:hypothetical protein
MDADVTYVATWKKGAFVDGSHVTHKNQIVVVFHWKNGRLQPYWYHV